MLLLDKMVSIVKSGITLEVYLKGSMFIGTVSVEILLIVGCPMLEHRVIDH